MVHFRRREARPPGQLVCSRARDPDHLGDLIDSHQGHVCKARGVSRATVSRRTTQGPQARAFGAACYVTGATIVVDGGLYLHTWLEDLCTSAADKRTQNRL